MNSKEFIIQREEFHIKNSNKLNSPIHTIRLNQIIEEDLKQCKKLGLSFEQFVNEFSILGEMFEDSLIKYKNKKIDKIIEKPKEFSTYKNTKDRPKHYQGIDSIQRAEANLTNTECIAIAKFNIDKYTWRTKGQDIDDCDKIIAYANWFKKLLKKGE